MVNKSLLWLQFPIFFAPSLQAKKLRIGGLVGEIQIGSTGGLHESKT